MSFTGILTFLCLIVGLTTAQSMTLEDRTFHISGHEFHENIYRDQDREVIYIPKQTGSDNTIVYHDYKQGLSAYKDLTEELCFISPIYTQIIDMEGVLFKYQAEEAFGTHIRLTDQGRINNVQKFAGDEIAEFCSDLDTNLALLHRQGGRQRRGVNVAASGTISISRKGISVSGSVSAGRHSASSSSSSRTGGRGVSVSIGGSFSASRRGVSGSASASAGKRSSSAGGSSSNSKGASSSSSSSD